MRNATRRIAIVAAGVIGISGAYMLAGQLKPDTENTGKAGKIPPEIREMLAPDMYIIDQAAGDVTGDGKDDAIYLVGRKKAAQDHFAGDLNIIVWDAAFNKALSADLAGIGGYMGQLFIGDFSGDKIGDVLINVPTGGSGGVVEHVIATFTDNAPQIIFDRNNNAGIKFTGNFTDGFKAELESGFLGRKISIDIYAHKAIYLQTGIYDAAGKLLQGRKPWADPFTLLEPVDADRDGTFELRGHQQIAGAFHADTIARVTSLWKFADNLWHVQQIEISSYLL